MRFDPKAAQLFRAPSTELERSFLASGVYYHWIRYEDGSTPRAGAFKGYALYADPFHSGLSRISFLMGTDCSHFVHRLFQILGAEFPYLKTRHMIAFLKKRERPGDLSECRWKMLGERFTPLAAGDRPRAGDLAVWENEVGEHGEHGHVALVVGEEGDEVLHAQDHVRGINRMKRSRLDAPQGYLRWRAPLRTLPAQSLEKLMERRFEFDPSGCSGG